MIDYNAHHLSLGDDWDYSKTTLKALCKVLADNLGGDWKKADITKAKADGVFTDEYGETWTINGACNEFFTDFMNGISE